MRTFRGIICLVWTLLFVGTAAGQFEPDPPTYGTKRALVVGINYDAQTTPVDKRLKHAQADAEAFHQLLLSNYGFAAENATLLLGENANYKAIHGHLEKLWTESAEDDCVLVYFSGHGFARDAGTSDKQGELLPSDVEFTRDGPKGVVVEMKWLVEKLGEPCKSRHKLIVLDCCQSGAVFSAGGRGANIFDTSRLDESVFRAAGFQAMTASRDLQQASDGKDGHSPFTAALLTALQQLPTKRKKDSPITTTELFKGMQVFLDRSLDLGQSPRCSWLDGGQGEFHFFPTGDFPDPEIPDDRIDKVMLAMVPGSFGLWWFEETPWFMPSLRYKILEEDAEGRSLTRDTAGRKMISADELEAAARKTRDRLASDPNESLGTQVRILDRMLDTKGTQWRENVDAVIADLQTLTSGPKPEAVDWHYLAVLMHYQQMNTEKVKEAYAEAQELYEQRAELSPEFKPLLALCLSDRGRFALDKNQFEEACDYFTKARSVYGGITPQPFQIYVLCSEAEALSRLGRKGAAKERLDGAAKAADEIDPATGYSLLASLHNRRAWMEMNWCEFANAEVNFAKSTEILSVPGRDSHDAKILCFHNDHGTAMSRRFCGDRDAALDLYRTLLEDKIYKRVVDLRDNPGRETNYQQVKSRLVERWVNTLERMGDCSLFGQPIDAAEAADDYRRGLQACSYLPKEKQSTWMRRLHSKRALALALPGTTIHDPQQASVNLKGVHEAALTGGPTIVGQKGIEICAQLAEYLIGIKCNEPGEVAAGSEANVAGKAEHAAKPEGAANKKLALHTMLEEVFHRNLAGATLDRDELEAALFAMRTIVEAIPQSQEAVATSGNVPQKIEREDIDLLLRFCRLGRSGGPEALAFVRPYFNCAIDALAASNPKDSKELIEIAWESLNGVVHFKPRDGRSTLLLYCSAEKAYFFLDVPHGTSSVYKLPAGLDLELIRNASQGRRDQLPLPAALRKELMAVPNGLRVCWHDRVNRLGGPLTHRVARRELIGTLPDPIAESAEPVEAVPTGDTPLGSDEDVVFPFAIPEFINVLGDPPVRKADILVTGSRPDPDPQLKRSEPVSSAQSGN